MGRPFFFRLAAAAACAAASACGSATSTGGAQARADFSFSSEGELSPATEPLALGTSATVRVRLRSIAPQANAAFESEQPAILRVASSSRGPTPDVVFVVLDALGEGKSRLTVKDGAAVVDTIELSVAAIAKLELPSSVDVGVRRNEAVTVVARSASGDALWAPSAIAWSVDHPELAVLWDSVRNTGYAAASGTSLVVHGVAPGDAALHGVYGATPVTIPLHVK